MAIRKVNKHYLTSIASEVKRLLAREIPTWRGLPWYLAVMVGFPAVHLAAARLVGHDSLVKLPRWDRFLLPLPVTLVTDPGPLGEEFAGAGSRCRFRCGALNKRGRESLVKTPDPFSPLVGDQRRHPGGRCTELRDLPLELYGVGTGRPGGRDAPFARIDVAEVRRHTQLYRPASAEGSDVAMGRYVPKHTPRSFPGASLDQRLGCAIIANARALFRCTSYVTVASPF
jgi:hypothetical protein